MADEVLRSSVVGHRSMPNLHRFYLIFEKMLIIQSEKIIKSAWINILWSVLGEKMSDRDIGRKRYPL